MGPPCDKPQYPLLDDSSAGKYSYAPLQRLLRPPLSSTSSAECPHGSSSAAAVIRQRRRWLRMGQRTRVVLLASALALGIGLLVLWLFLLLVPIRDGGFGRSISAIPPATTTLLVPKWRHNNEMDEEDQQRRRENFRFGGTNLRKNGKSQHKPKHHVVIHVTAPLTQATTTTTTAKTMSALTTEISPTIFAKMDLGTAGKGTAEDGGGGGKGRKIVAQMENNLMGTAGEGTAEDGGGGGKGWKIVAQMENNLMGTAPTADEAPLTTTTKRVSTTMGGERDEGEEGDEEDLFWMRGRMALGKKNQQQKTGGIGGAGREEASRGAGEMPPKVTKAEVAPTHSSPTKIPPFGTTAAAAPTASPPPAAELPLSPSSTTSVLIGGYNVKRPIIEFGPMKAKEMRGEERDREREEEQVRQELNEIIASVERDSWSERSEQDKNGVNPVQIPFDPSGSPYVPQPEPVWRRPPPGEQIVPSSALPKKEKSEEFAKLELDRNRRESPVIVTALVDIGRGEWQRFTRHFDQYLGYLANILSRLQNHMIIFCDPTVTAHLRAMGDRIGWDRLQVVEISLAELPFYRYRNEIDAIMRWEHTHWRSSWDEQMRAHPEAIYPDYDILVNSKPFFLFNATQISRFPKPSDGTQPFFVWMDAGYGHGSTSSIPFGVWSPVLEAGKITLVQLTSKLERVERYTLDKVYRKQRSVVSGGFLAGSPDAIRRFWTFFYISFLEMLDKKMVDDDQTTILVTIQKFRSTFNILFGKRYRFGEISNIFKQ